MINSVLAIAGQFGITVICAVTIAYGAFRYFGDKWLTNKFSESLETFKHAQQQELERLKLEINTAFDRIMKLHTQEFEILPELWERLSDVLYTTLKITASYQEYSDLNRMTPAELEYFMEKAEIPEFQKEILRHASDKTKEYTSIRDWQLMTHVSEKRQQMDRYFLLKGIFVPRDIREPIEKIATMIWNALLEKRINMQYPESAREDMNKAQRQLADEGEKLHREIEQLIRDRLWANATV